MLFWFFGVIKSDDFAICARPARSILFLSVAPQGKIKEKKIPRVGGELVGLKWDVAAMKIIMSFEL